MYCEMNVLKTNKQTNEKARVSIKKRKTKSTLCSCVLFLILLGMIYHHR